MTGHSMMIVCQILTIARRTAYYVARARPGGRYHRADDHQVLRQLQGR